MMTINYNTKVIIPVGHPFTWGRGVSWYMRLNNDSVILLNTGELTGIKLDHVVDFDNFRLANSMEIK